jgi:hypothetical protein
MARSHHRKKHKEHLRQFKNKSDTSTPAPKSKAAAVFAVGGAVIGMAVTYFAAAGSLLWILIGTVLGAAAGYLVGRRVDAET